MSTPTSIRLREQLRKEIDRIARRSRRSLSAVAQDLLEEAVRMRICPGIYFADEPAGREAKVMGTGLGVWEVIRDYRDLGGTVEAVREALPHLSPAHVEACLRYYARNPEEIDAAIEENAATTLEVAQSRLPTFVRPA